MGVNLGTYIGPRHCCKYTTRFVKNHCHFSRGFCLLVLEQFYTGSYDCCCVMGTSGLTSLSTAVTVWLLGLSSHRSPISTTTIFHYITI